MFSIKDIIEAQLNVAREEIAANMVAQNRKASGNSINKMRVEATEISGKLIDGSGYLFASEYGRRPNKSQPGRPSRAMVDSIERWTVIKGIIAANGNQRSIAYAIATKIAKEGNLLFREIEQGGPQSGVITNAINQEWLNRTAQLVSEKFVTLIKSEVVRNTNATVI